MERKETRHEIVSVNPDVEVRFYFSEDPGSYVNAHWHNSLEIVYMIEGSMQVTYENKSETIQSGEFSLVNSRTIHSVLSQKNKALVLQIPEMLFEKFVPGYDLLYYEVDMHPRSEVEQTKLQKLKKIFMDMHVVYDIRPEGYLLKFNSLLYELLFTLIHSYSKKTVRKEIDKKNKYLQRLKQIMQYVDNNHCRLITVSEVADEFGYSPDYLSKFFKKHMNMTMLDYLYEIRIHYIYQDLVGTDQYLNDIFTKHGCTNYKVTMKRFKERYGKTPKELRKSLEI